MPGRGSGGLRIGAILDDDARGGLAEKSAGDFEQESTHEKAHQQDR
jgi:hypothetical protein